MPAFGPAPARRVRRSLAFAGIVAAAFAAGCAGSGAAPEKTPGEAASDVAKILVVDDATQTCLERSFGADPASASGLNRLPGHEPTGPQIDALKATVRTCLDPKAQADLYASLVQSSFTGITTDAVECVRSKTLALSPEDQDTLLMGAIRPTTEEFSFQLLLSSKLIQPCGLANFLPDKGVEPTGPPGTGPVSASGTVITR